MINLFKNILNSLRIFRLIIKHRIYVQRVLFLKFIIIFLAIIFFPIFFIKTRSYSIGKRINLFVLEAGPIFIKFGQILSSCPELVGEELANELRNLQDNMPAFDQRLVIKILEDDLGKNLNELFESFELIPTTAASIAQVHKAKTLANEEVAVKVLRPYIRERYKKDIAFLYFIARILSRLLKNYKRLRLIEVVDIFKQNMQVELNLKMEAASMEEMREMFIEDNTVYIPKVMWALTEENVLVTEWIDGISIYDTKALSERNLDPSILAKNLAICFLNQAYKNGFFHADIHPGNILINDNGAIVFLDFGITGRIEEEERISMAEILYELINQNYEKVAKIHVDIGYIPMLSNISHFAQSMRVIGSKFIHITEERVDINKLVIELLKIREEYGMYVQPQLIMLQKTIVMVDSLCKTLSPGINMWNISEPWVKNWASVNLTLKGKVNRVIKKHIKKFFG